MKFMPLGAAFAVLAVGHLGHLAAAVSQTIDVVGDMSRSAFDSNLAKANVYRVDVSTTLREQEFRLDFTGTKDLIFSVYEGPVEFGAYTRIQTNSVLSTGVGLEWYSSGPLNVPLNASNYYLMSVSWPGSLQYFFDAEEQQFVSFGAHVHAYASGTHPLGSMVTTTINDQAVYNHRVTTGIPEPSAAMLMAISCGGMAYSRCRRWSAPRAAIREMPSDLQAGSPGL